MTVLHIWTYEGTFVLSSLQFFLIFCSKNFSCLINAWWLRKLHNKLHYCLLLPAHVLCVFILRCSLCLKCRLFEVWSGRHFDTWWSFMLLTSVQMLGLAVDRPGCMHQSVFSMTFFFLSLKMFQIRLKLQWINLVFFKHVLLGKFEFLSLMVRMNYMTVMCTVQVYICCKIISVNWFWLYL